MCFIKSINLKTNKCLPPGDGAAGKKYFLEHGGRHHGRQMLRGTDKCEDEE